MSVRVKICGVVRAEDARAAARLGADLIGVNFYPQSPRAVTVERAREIRAALGGGSRLVGVFVNSPREFVAEMLGRVKLDMLQFHGDEPGEMLRGWPVPVIRALRLKPGEIPELARGAADYVLIDTFHPGLYGGTGAARQLDCLRGLDLGRVLIAGGLDPDNVAGAAALSPYAVDAASGVESSCGVKDYEKLRRFIENAKSSR